MKAHGDPINRCKRAHAMHRCSGWRPGSDIRIMSRRVRLRMSEDTGKWWILVWWI
jgi:hypothetical protein